MIKSNGFRLGLTRMLSHLTTILDNATSVENAKELADYYRVMSLGSLIEGIEESRGIQKGYYAILEVMK